MRFANLERIIALLPAFALAACTAAPAREAAPDLPTIVSLNPCTDAVLAEIADPGQLLAISSYSHDPASSSMGVEAARRFASTGGTVEEIAALQPDLVISGAFMAPATSQALDRLGYRLELLPIAPDVATSKAQVRRIAALAGHPERGEAMIARIDAALAKAEPPPGPPLPAIIWQSGGIVAGEGTLVSDLLARTGFSNMAAARGLGQANYLPLETMLADPPRVIFASGDPRSNEDRLLGHPALGGLKDTRRVTYDSSLLWCGGPTIPKAVARMAEVRASFPLPLAEGARGGAVVGPRLTGPPPTPPASGRGE
jgi:iron complex transport system substrate-binding protein